MNEKETSPDIAPSIEGWRGELGSRPDEARESPDLTEKGVSVVRRDVYRRVPMWPALVVLAFVVFSLAAPSTAYAREDAQAEPAVQVGTEAALSSASVPTSPRPT